MKNTLRLVEDRRQIAASHASFCRELGSAKEDALDMVRRTHYWVYDPVTRSFSTSKFSGYVGMDFRRYGTAGDRELTRGARFQGTLARLAISRTLGEQYVPDTALARELGAWIEKQFGAGALVGIDRGKWRFVRLPVSGAGGLATLAGGWEGSDELVEVLESVRRTPGRPGPDLGEP
jgi:hypothetical protein